MISIFECNLRIGGTMIQHSEVYHLEEGCKSCKEVAQALILEVFHTAEELGLKDEGKT